MSKEERDAAGNRIVDGIHCPVCGAQVVYNGNYFCTRWVYPFNGQRYGCNWAMSHGEDGEPLGRTDQRVWDEIKASEWFENAIAERDAAVARVQERIAKEGT